jgi:aldehyde dehydrogenase (NAD+)
MPIDVPSVLRELRLQPISSGAFAGEWLETSGALLESKNPATGEVIGSVRQASAADYDRVAQVAQAGFERWRMLPAPARGEIVRQIGDELRRVKRPLGALVAMEMGKILQEGLGEVQEMIDICDFATGLSRQLYGLTMHSERPSHRMYEQWHPLGVVGIISAFNFPTAVWSWNAAIAAVCGDSMIWKPSSLTPLTAVATQHIVNDVMRRAGYSDVMALVVGSGAEVGDRMLHDKRVPLISATGSCKMGVRTARVVGERFGRTILELGGNNGVIVMDDADLELALRAVTFGAIGTAGQRCTTIRRLIVHRKIADTFLERLIAIYKQIKIGNPIDDGVLMGPLVSEAAVQDMMNAMDTIRAQGGEVLYGGRRITEGKPAGSWFVEPTIVRARADMPIVKDETFAPILYCIAVDSLDEAIRVHNDVPQGLSSAIFTLSMRSAERFLSAAGSDCGIANVNIGTSGAEIGGAFGGEKETGGGREAGSDSWKQYMRRQTCTINYGTSLPLAQGITFG